MLIISLTFSFREEIREQALQICAEMVKASQNDQGCITFSVSTDLLDPKMMRLYEEWENQETLQAHHETPHYHNWRKAMAALGKNAMRVHSVARYEATPLEMES